MVTVSLETELLLVRETRSLFTLILFLSVSEVNQYFNNNLSTVTFKLLYDFWYFWIYKIMI